MDLTPVDLDRNSVRDFKFWVDCYDVHVPLAFHQAFKVQKSGSGEQHSLLYFVPYDQKLPLSTKNSFELTSMGSIFDAPSLNRVSEWVHSANESSASSADSQSAGGVPLPRSVNSDYARSFYSSAGLVTRQGLRHQQVPNSNRGLHVTLTGIIYPTDQQLQIVQPVANNQQQDKSRYTMALMEHGQKTGYVPNYDFQILGQAPPSHRCDLNVQGINTSATASTVKEAKHQASYNACQTLGVRPK